MNEPDEPNDTCQTKAEEACDEAGIMWWLFDCPMEGDEYNVLYEEQLVYHTNAHCEDCAIAEFLNEGFYGVIHRGSM